MRCVLYDINALSRNVMILLHALQERYHYIHDIVNIHCITSYILRGIWGLIHSQYVTLAYITTVVHIYGQNVVVPFLNTTDNSMKLQQPKNKRQALVRNSVCITLNARLTIVCMGTIYLSYAVLAG